MAAVRDVPDVSRQQVAVGSRHHLFLDGTFEGKNWPSKLSIDAFYAILRRQQFVPVRPVVWAQYGQYGMVSMHIRCNRC